MSGVDFIKTEVDKIRNNITADGDDEDLVNVIKEFLETLKQESECINNNVPKNNLYKAVIRFDIGCEMENIRAYTIVHNLKEFSNDIFYIPEDIIDSDECINVIRENGFQINFKTELDYQKVNEFFMNTAFIRDLELVQLEEETTKTEKIRARTEHQDREAHSINTAQSIISVNVAKLDKLMDLVGEMVIAEAMVIQNPDLEGLQLDNFSRAANHLNKITSELQDIVMSIRMVPLSATFIKMHRIVRDMCKKLDKDVRLDIIGEETEVDKNIIEHISDQLMHLVRNAVDHGIESAEKRIAKGKQGHGTVTLEAKNAGSDVLIIIRDDGKGLNKDKIIAKARENGILYKDEEEITDREAYNLILLPGFSTNENVSEFSGRGVGMDVVSKNIETIGGSVSIDSIPDKGTVITLKIPLTLAIIDGMNIKVGNTRYTIPTISIKESFRPRESDVFTDPDGNEMIMVRGECYAVRRLHEIYKVKTKITKFAEGIIIMVEHDDKRVCIFADELLGQQQVVVKALPQYIQNFKMTNGLAGCTLLGECSISLILDISGLFNKYEKRQGGNTYEVV